MRLADTCRHYAPYRSADTHRPRPTRCGVCRFPVVWQALPNAYDTTPRLPRPITPDDCVTCLCYEARSVEWAEPLKQREFDV